MFSRALALISLFAAAPAHVADPKSDAHALLTAWLDAQNAGNFDAYQSLYPIRLGPEVAARAPGTPPAAK